MIFAFKQLTSTAFLAELHHFLWDEPHVNRGTFDVGWNCRDHAWIVSLLARAAGFRETIVFRGKAIFAAPRQAATQRFVLTVATHSWVGIPDHGQIDLSVKSECRYDGRVNRLRIGVLFLDRFVGASPAKFVPLPDYTALPRAMDWLETTGRSVGIYALGPEYDGLQPEIITGAADYINSPLTDWLKQRFDADDAYAALFLHLLTLLKGGRKSYANLARAEAWQRVVEDHANPIDEAISAAGF